MISDGIYCDRAMSDQPRDQHIESLCNQFLEDLRAGRNPSLNKLVRSHPELQPDLQERLKLFETIFRAGNVLQQKDRRKKHQNATATALETRTDEGEEGDADDSLSSVWLDSPMALIQQADGILICPDCGGSNQPVDPTEKHADCVRCGSRVTIANHVKLVNANTGDPLFVGRYELRRQIGTGSFGLVFLAIDPDLQRDVALKVPRQGYFVSRDDERRFFREAQSGAKLNHAGIVAVHDVSLTGELPYIASEFVDGKTLAEWMDDGLKTRDAVQFVIKICDALDHAHRHGVVHRDIKPSNILIDQHQAPRITDFGLAYRDDVEMTMTLEGTVLGTPAYMAPEQAAGHRSLIGARSDIYSVGVILYKMLCGELPFSGGKRMMIYQVIHEDPVRPTKLNTNIPVDLETITLKAMAKAQEDRFQTAGAMRTELQRWLDGKAIETRPPSFLQRTVRWCRKHPIEATFAATVFIFLTVAVFFLWDRAVEERRLRGIADARLRESQKRLHEIFEQNGYRALEENRLISSAYWFVKASELDDSPMAQLRIGMLMDRLPKLQTLFPMEGAINVIRISASGNRMAIGTQSGLVTVWDLRSQEKLYQFATGTQTGVFDLEFLDREKKIAIRVNFNLVEVHDIASQELVHQCTEDMAISKILAINDGKCLVVAVSGNVVKFLDVKGNPIVPSFSLKGDESEESKKGKEGRNGEFLSCLETSSQTKRLVLGTMSIEPKTNKATARLRLFDVTNMQLVATHVDHNPLKAEVSPDGRELLVQSGEHNLKRLDLATGKVVGEVNVPNAKISQSWFLDHNHQVAFRVNLNSIRTYDFNAKQFQDCFRADFNSAAPLTSPNRDLIAVEDSSEQVVRFICPRSGCEPVSRIENLATHAKIVFLEDSGKVLVEHQDGYLRLWDLAGGLPSGVAWDFQGAIQDVELIDQSSLAWIVPSGLKPQLVNTLAGHQVASVAQQAESNRAALSPSKRWLMTVGGKIARVWDAKTGEAVGVPIELEDSISSITFAPDAQHVAFHLSGKEDNLDRISVHYWDDETATSSQRFQHVFAGKIACVAFDKTGDRLAVTTTADDGLTWSLGAGVPPSRLKGRKHTWQRVCFTDQSDEVVVTGVQKLNLFDSSDGTLLQTLKCDGTPSFVMHSRFQDQDWLVAISGSVIMIWQRDDDGSFHLYRQFRSQYRLNRLALSVDHRKLVSVGGPPGDQCGTATVWDPLTGKPIGPPVRFRLPVFRLDITDDGNAFIAGSQGGSAKFIQMSRNTMPRNELVQWLEINRAEVESDETGATESMATTDAFRTLSTQFPELKEVPDQKSDLWLR